jgi:hypothetical protein
LNLALVEGRDRGNNPWRQLAQGHLQEGVIAEIVLAVITTEQHALGCWLGQGNPKQLMLKSIALVRSPFHRVPEPNPIGGVGRAKMLDQGITGFFMELLQTAGHNPKLAPSGIGLNPLGMAGRHIENNLAHNRVTSFSA